MAGNWITFLTDAKVGEDIRPKRIDQMIFRKLNGIAWQDAGASEALYSFSALRVTKNWLNQCNQ